MSSLNCLIHHFSIEAKKRGLSATGKKDQILTRLLIWVRDQIAHSVDPNESRDGADADVIPEGTPTISNGSIDASNMDESEDNNLKNHGGVCGNDSDDESDDSKSVADNQDTNTGGMIELSDDESCYTDDSENDELSSDELEIPDGGSKLSKKRNIALHSESSLHEALEHYFGYKEFREGQEWAIRRCMSHERSLLVAPTGQGKLLCYALPAAIMDGICLVVSPLISLMQDQLRQLPPKIPAATLSGSMTTAQMALIVDDIMRGRYKVLFVSPERLASAAFRRLVRISSRVSSLCRRSTLFKSMGPQFSPILPKGSIVASIN